MPNDALGIENARRHVHVLKELVRREREYTKGFVNLNRLFEIGVLEKGLVGDPKKVAEKTFDDLNSVIDALGFLHIVASFEAEAVRRIVELIAATTGKLREQAVKGVLPGVSSELLRDKSEFENSLKKIFDLLRTASPTDADKFDPITTTRND